MATRRRDLRACHAQILAPHTRFTWEIGSGHGHFLAAYAHAHPAELCIGIDIIGERVERAQRKRDRASLANLHFIHAEARLFLETLPADATFSRLFILFPDPWPKLRHHKHRIMQPDFLASVAARAGEGAPLFPHRFHPVLRRYQGGAQRPCQLGPTPRRSRTLALRTRNGFPSPRAELPLAHCAPQTACHHSHSTAYPGPVTKHLPY